MADQRRRPCRPDRNIAVGLFVVAFVTYAWFFNGGGWNQNAQFDLARALVERQTFHIDGYHVNTGDVSWAVSGGERRVYINKAPGVSMLAAIPYAGVYAVERALGVPVDTWLMMTINAWIVTALTCGVTGALIPAVLYVYARRRAGATAAAALFVALTIAFATIVFPYSTMLFTHVPSALFLLLAFVWLDERPLLAGAAAGMAGLSFYLAIVGAAILAVAVLLRSRRAALRFAAGALPFAALFGWYHQVCFGAPWRTAVERSTGFTEQDRIMGVFAAPTSEALWGLTFSEFRGLFFVSPVLLLALAGAAVMIARRTMLRELAMVAAIFFAFLLTNAGFNGWSGGSAWGPRYLLGAIPLLGLPMLFAWRRGLATIGVALAIVSAAMQFVVTAVDPMPSANLARPLRMYQLPVFLTGNVPQSTAPRASPSDLHTGKVSTNAQTVDELVPYEIYPRHSHEARWASLNLGELFFGQGNRTSVLPIALWLLAGVVVLVRQARS